MREKIAEIIADYFLGEPKAIHLACADKILALLHDYHNPKDEYYIDILEAKLRSIPSLDGIVVEEECSCEHGIRYSGIDEAPEVRCYICHGTGTITRQAEWGDLEYLAEWLDSWMQADKSLVFEVPSGGRLRMKE